MFVVVAVGETDNFGVMAVAETLEAAQTYVDEIAAQEIYPADDLVVIEARKV